jgi:MYXO-CTERM domain-containing protein
VAGALACALVAAAPSPAHAFVRSTANMGGPCLFWGTRGHSYMIDDSLGGGGQVTPDVPTNVAVDAVNASYGAWAAVTCSDLSFPNLGLNVDPKNRRVGYVQGGFNINLVFWRTALCKLSVPASDPCFAAGTCGNIYDCWDKSADIIAVTTTTFNRVTGEIYDADIELNGAPHDDGTSRFQFANITPGPNETCSTSSQLFDIRNTLTHEAGHSIGLGHSLDQTATMFATAPPGDTCKRTLHPDDILGVCTIYPKGQPTSTCLGDPLTLAPGAESDGGGCGCSPRGNSGALEALAGLALLLAWKKRRR